MATTRTAAKNRSIGKRKSKTRKQTARKWSGKVTQTSDALDLKPRIFKSRDPVKVARSLKRSAEKSKRKKGTPLQSAMSMLNFYLNRAGKKLPTRDKKVLHNAKDELRKLFGREKKES